VKHAVVAGADEALKPISVDTFKEEVRAWAVQIGVEPVEIHVRPMKQKWASCSSRGRITFDSALLAQPAAFRDEVIVHELVHLKVPNHGALFKTLVRAHMRDSAKRLS
jgi:predicted metal-dependent hydrolase